MGTKRAMRRITAGGLLLAGLGLAFAVQPQTHDADLSSLKAARALSEPRTARADCIYNDDDCYWSPPDLGYDGTDMGSGGDD